MNICDVSTSNLIRSLDSYHAARENGEKAYIIYNGNELEVKTLTLWDRINLFVQKLFGNTTTDTLYGQIQKGYETIQSVGSELKVQFEKKSLFSTKVQLVKTLKARIINNLAKESFGDVKEAYILALYLGIHSRPHTVVMESRGFSGFKLKELANDPKLHEKLQERLKQSLQEKKLKDLCNQLNQDYFGGNQVFKERSILPS
jgi:hypothetical protein